MSLIAAVTLVPGRLPGDEHPAPPPAPTATARCRRPIAQQLTERVSAYGPAFRISPAEMETLAEQVQEKSLYNRAGGGPSLAVGHGAHLLEHAARGLGRVLVPLRDHVRGRVHTDRSRLGHARHPFRGAGDASATSPRCAGVAPIARRAGLDHERLGGAGLGPHPVVGDRRPRGGHAGPHQDVRHREPAPGRDRAGARHDRDAEAPSAPTRGSRACRWSSSATSRSPPAPQAIFAADPRVGALAAARAAAACPRHPERLADRGPHGRCWPFVVAVLCGVGAQGARGRRPRRRSRDASRSRRARRRATCSTGSSPSRRTVPEARGDAAAAIEARYSRPAPLLLMETASARRHAPERHQLLLRVPHPARAEAPRHLRALFVLPGGRRLRRRGRAARGAPASTDGWRRSSAATPARRPPTSGATSPRPWRASRSRASCFEEIVAGCRMDLTTLALRDLRGPARVLPPRRLGRGSRLHRDLRLLATRGRATTPSSWASRFSSRTSCATWGRTRSGPDLPPARGPGALRRQRGGSCSRPRSGAGSAPDRPRRAARLRGRARARRTTAARRRCCPARIAARWSRPR